MLRTPVILFVTWDTNAGSSLLCRDPGNPNLKIIIFSNTLATSAAVSVLAENASVHRENVCTRTKGYLKFPSSPDRTGKPIFKLWSGYSSLVSMDLIWGPLGRLVLGLSIIQVSAIPLIKLFLLEVTMTATNQLYRDSHLDWVPWWASHMAWQAAIGRRRIVYDHPPAIHGLLDLYRSPTFFPALSNSSFVQAREYWIALPLEVWGIVAKLLVLGQPFQHLLPPRYSPLFSLCSSLVTLQWITATFLEAVLFPRASICLEAMFHLFILYSKHTTFLPNNPVCL